MAHPWDVEFNFETGDNTQWTTETDTASQLDFPSYRTLAALPQGVVPYTGAYCMRIVLGANTTRASLETTVATAGDNEAGSFQFNIMLLDDLRNTHASTTDHFGILEFEDAGTSELSVNLSITAADVVTMSVADNIAGASSAPQSAALERNVWYTASIVYNIDESANSDGDMTLYLTKEGSLAATVSSSTDSSMTQGHPDQLNLGTQLVATETLGTILFDNFIQDSDTTRLWPRKHRWPKQRKLTKSGHLFVGAGTIEKASFTAVGDADEMHIYDTDTANKNDETDIVGQAKSQGADETIYLPGPIHVRRGAYVWFENGGTEQNDSEAIFEIGHAAGYGSNAAVIRQGRNAGTE